MKIITFFLFLGCLTAAAAGSAQRVTLSQKNVKLEKIFREIRKQTGYVFFYDSRVLQNSKLVNIHVTNAPVEDALRETLQGQSLDFSIERKTITIVRIPVSAMAVVNTLSSTPANVINGTVKDEKGNTLAGVSIILKETNKGTSTNAAGRFTIEANVGDVLEFTIVGYQKKSVNVGQSNSLSIIMEIEETVGDEVIVVGYGTQKRSNLTGAIGTINASDIENRPITSASQSLAGKIAGVHIAQGSGIAGADEAQITIRGLGTLGNTSPLILIDGVISGNFDILNPSDIESISVLKDAASASIYGSQAANGVVLITTKKGSFNEKPVFKFSTGFSASDITKNSKPKMVRDPVLFMTLMNEARINSNGQAAFTEEVIEQYRTPAFRDAASVDWFDELVKTGYIKEHDISARGGSEKTKYFFSLGYMDQGAIIMEGNYNRITSRINLDTRITPAFTLGTNFGYTYGNQKTPNGSINDVSLLSIMRGTPLNPAYTDDGYLALPDFTTLQQVGQVQSGNPLAEYSANDVRQTRNNIVANIFAEWEIVNDLKVRADFTANVGLFDNMGWYGRPTVKNWRYKEILADPNRQPTEGSVNFYGFGRLEKQSSRSYNINPYLKISYTRSFGEHVFDIFAASSIEKNKWDWTNTSRGNYQSNYVRIFSAGDPTTATNESRITQSAVVSQFGRLNYRFDDKYLIEANIRRDGSSRFGPNYKYGVFPSFSLGWILSRENFFAKNVSAINFLKLRASWGRLGNQGGGDDFPYIAKISYSGANYVFGNDVVTGARATTYGNPDLHWETTTITDIGFNLNLLKDAITLEADYFIKKSTEVLYNTPLPQETGFGSVISNLASVKNTGFEATLNFNKNFGKFALAAGINGSRIKNEVLEINPDLTGENDKYISGDRILTRGKPIDSYYLVNWTGGIFQDKQEIDKLPSQFGAAPGDLIFEDISGPEGTPDGLIDGYDREPQGTQYPVWSFGANFSINYGGFGLSINFQGIADAYSYGSHEYFYPTFQGSNIAEHWIDRWTPERPSQTKPRLWVEDGPNTENLNTYFLMDRSYLRLKNIVLSYNLPQNLIQRSFFSDAQVFVSGQNVFTWTNYKGFDPERLRQTGSRGGIPQARIIKIGLNIKL